MTTHKYAVAESLEGRVLAVCADARIALETVERYNAEADRSRDGGDAIFTTYRRVEVVHLPFLDHPGGVVTAWRRRAVFGSDGEMITEWVPTREMALDATDLGPDWWTWSPSTAVGPTLTMYWPVASDDPEPPHDIQQAFDSLLTQARGARFEDPPRRRSSTDPGGWRTP